MHLRRRQIGGSSWKAFCRTILVGSGSGHVPDRGEVRGCVISSPEGLDSGIDWDQWILDCPADVIGLYRLHDGRF
jgi:hypothetical protein